MFFRGECRHLGEIEFVIVMWTYGHFDNERTLFVRSSLRDRERRWDFAYRLEWTNACLMTMVIKENDVSLTWRIFLHLISDYLYRTHVCIPMSLILRAPDGVNIFFSDSNQMYLRWNVRIVHMVCHRIEFKVIDVLAHRWHIEWSYQGRASVQIISFTAFIY